MASNRKGGIPIPSFGTAVDVSPSVHGSPSHAGTTTSTVPARWNVASLLQLEVALQHWFHKQGTSTSRAGKMTLDEFFALVRKLDWSQLESNHDENTKNQDATLALTTHDTASTNDNDKPPPPTEIHPHDALVSHLSKEERLLHDLLCLTANPSLMTKNNNTALYTIDLDTCTLEPRQSSAEKLKRLMASTKFLEEPWSQKVCTMLQKHKEKKVRLQEKAASLKDHNRPKQPLPTIQAIITKDMTVDERVRAREKAKQQNEEQSQQAQKSQGNPLLACLNNDRTWLIQLADALWNHARGHVQRQNQHLPNKLASNSLLLAESNNTKRQRTGGGPKLHNPQCSLTFKDVITCISKSRIGEASAIQIAKALTELATFTPKFITVFKQEEEDGRRANKKNNKRNANDAPQKQSFKWSRTTTTILVRPDRYHAVRSQLTGEPMPTGGYKAKINIVTDTNPKTSMAKTAPATSSAAVPNRKRASPVLAKNLLGDFDDTAAANAKRSKTAVVPSTPAAAGPSSFGTSKASTPSLPNSSNNIKKRERESMEASNTTTKIAGSGSSSPAKHKKRLRINYENIIIEEDRTGGIVLPPSELLAASPRSLNQLFRRLKDGKRI